MKKLTVLDLFSGIGGFSLGLERAGMRTAAFCEIDKPCQKVLKKHWPDIPIFEDVKKLKPAPGEFDVVCGGFPCQDISVAGQKKGLKNGTRSSLWKEFKRIIKEAQPRYAIIENVANLRNLGLNEVIKDLWSIGYACEWHIISARSIGACHLRERIWIIAYPYCLGVEGRGIRSEQREARKEGKVSACLDDLADANMPRLWKPFASEKESSRRWAEATACFRNWWSVESTICRVDDGVLGRVDRGRRERIKQLGNSVLPQIPELIGREIMNFEKTIK